MPKELEEMLRAAEEDANRTGEMCGMGERLQKFFRDVGVDAVFAIEKDSVFAGGVVIAKREEGEMKAPMIPMLAEFLELIGELVKAAEASKDEADVQKNISKMNVVSKMVTHMAEELNKTEL